MSHVTLLFRAFLSCFPDQSFGPGRALRAGLFALAFMCAPPSLARAQPDIKPARGADAVVGEGAHGWLASGLGAVRGITVGPIESSQLKGRGYGTDTSAVLLDELVRLGATWVSVTPFGRLWSLSSSEIQPDFEAPYEDNRRAVARFVAQAHARGLKVLLIPHLWVETGGWRGDVDPGSPEGWARYRASYRAFVLGWAEVARAAGAEAFSIGVECKSWSGRFLPFWSALIRDVRARFAGLVTYSANWDEAQLVGFWEELDLIGINAFYPLAGRAQAPYADYLAGAQRARDEVARLSAMMERPVWFVEAGYTTRADAAVEPWLWPDDMTEVVYDEDEQARALAALLEVFAPEPWFAGLFVWRYYADLDDVSQEHPWGFSPHAKRAEHVLSQAFRYRWGSDPPTIY